MRKRVVGALLLAACSSGQSRLPFYRSAAMTPEWLSRRDATTGMHRVAAFTAVDQRGARITEGSLKGKATIVQFFFTGCGDVCPTTTRNIASVLAQLSGHDDVQVFSYSVRPVADSSAVLAEYAIRHGIVDARWHLLSTPDVERLARDSYFVRLGGDSTYGLASIAHTESVLLVDGDGRLRGVYAGTLRLDMDRLREDVATLLSELTAIASR